MNATIPAQSKPRRRIGRWIALGLAILLAPLLVLGAGVISMLRLDRNAAALKREVIAATDTRWNTKVQLSAGWVTLTALRTALSFIDHEHMDEARLALGAVRNASVGVYECAGRRPDLARGQLFKRADELMTRRGWTRLVGVAENRETVLVYTADDMGSGRRLDLCLAVVDGNQLVVVSTNVDAAALAELAEMHLPKDGLRSKLKQAKL